VKVSHQTDSAAFKLDEQRELNTQLANLQETNK